MLLAAFFFLVLIYPFFLFSVLYCIENRKPVQREREREREREGEIRKKKNWRRKEKKKLIFVFASFPRKKNITKKKPLFSYSHSTPSSESFACAAA